MNTTVTIATICAVCSFIIAAYNFWAARKKEIVDSASQFEEIKTGLIKVNMKLDQVCAATNETRVDIKAMNSQIQLIDKELEVVKRDLKTAFSRIDELREAQNGRD